MARSETATYRTEFVVYGPAYLTAQAWNPAAGRPTSANLAAYVAILEAQEDVIIAEAAIIRQSNDDVVASYSDR